MIREIRFERPLVHIVAWVLYILNDLALPYIQDHRGWNAILFVLLYTQTILLFYVNAYVVLPASMNNNKISYLRLAFMIIAEISIYLLLRYLSLIFLKLFNDVPPSFILPIPIFVSVFGYRAIRIIGLSFGYWFALRTYYNRKKINNLEIAGLQNELKKEELQKTLLVTENAYLKSQINPHFLLNTLNFLYNSVSKFSDKIADSVMTLSEMMRYALTNAGDDSKVNLVDELDHVANLVKLNQTRFNERLHIKHEVIGDAWGKRIIPLALVTLVENVFKYGDLLNETHTAQITAQIDNNLLTFSTFNLKKKNVREKSHGIGIKNVTDRLKMYHQYDLKIEENEQFYKSVLKVWL